MSPLRHVPHHTSPTRAAQGNPFNMNKEAKAVDNVGTIRLVDAAKAAGVTKVVMVSSILTNGRAWGQENSAGFQVANAFDHTHTYTRSIRMRACVPRR